MTYSLETFADQMVTEVKKQLPEEVLKFSLFSKFDQDYVELSGHSVSAHMLDDGAIGLTGHDRSSGDFFEDHEEATKLFADAIIKEVHRVYLSLHQN